MTEAHDKADETPIPALTLADFRAAGFARIIASHHDEDCQTLQRVLWPGGRPWDGGPRQALELAANVASMMLVPEQPTDIFVPVIRRADGTSSMAPGHLSAEDIEMLAQLAGGIENASLQARFADLVWLREKRRGPGYARMAIAAYLQQPLTPDNWIRSGRAAWHRAIQLTKQLKDAAGTAAIEEMLLQAFFSSCDTASDYSALHYLKPLRAERRSGGRAEEVAAKLAEVGDRMLAEKRPFEAQAYHEAAAEWFEWAHKGEERAMSLAGAAKALVQQAEMGDGAIVQHMWLTKAIEAYRRVPGQYRSALGIDQQIEDVRCRREAAGRATVGEMVHLRGPRIDVTEIVASSVDHVKERPPLEALFAFCGLDSPPDADELHAAAAASLKETPLSAIIAGTVLSGDGRQVEHVGGELAWDQQVGARARWMFRVHAAQIAQAKIFPARDQLRVDHHYRLEDFVAICERSPAVPADRARIVGQGLYAGFCGDMVQAMHLVMPQFEHMVRVILQGTGTLTAEHRPDGLDMEVALSSLVERPQMAQEFGNGLTLAIHALMCDRAGPNLRNEVAHGLADEAVCGTPYALYAWWLVLQLVVETFGGAVAAAGAGGRAESEQAAGQGE